MTDDRAAEVLAFWFETLKPRDWWRATPAVDARIRARFGPLHAALARDPPEPGTLDALGQLAAVVVLDQFSRHLHRGTAAAYANDDAALVLADDAIARRLDAALPARQRHFVYMPLMHAEDPDVQTRSVACFAALGSPSALRSAVDHRDTIARFGRFPARNAALGRPSTDDERAFLARNRRVDRA